MLPPQASSKPTKPGKQQQFLFVEHTASPHGKKNAQSKSVRVQAAKASSDARLDTLRKRAAERNGPPGQRIFAVSLPVRPLPCVATEKHQEVVRQCQDRDASVAAQNHKILGGPIPSNQAQFAILAQFLGRFRVPDGAQSERPWVELVMGSAPGNAGNSSYLMVETALQANATALTANDLRQPELYRQATKQHLWAISKLQSELKSARWHDPVVLYTVMVLTLYDCIVPQGDPLARLTHVRGVAQLFEQRGVHRFIHGLEHQCFRYFRINILMVALNDRKPCFLAGSEWKTIPFSAGDCPPKTVVDLLLDILLELPGVLAAAEALKTGSFPGHVLLQKVCELAYWVRRLIQDLERWKAFSVLTHPTVAKMPVARNLGLLELCDFTLGQEPYQTYLGEALNCYCAAHLMLARIAWALADQSFVLGVAVRAPYSLRELIESIILVSKRHIAAKTVGMVSMMVTAFPLKVAANSMTELDDKQLLDTIEGLLVQIDEAFARRFNISYSSSQDSIGIEE